MQKVLRLYRRPHATGKKFRPPGSKPVKEYAQKNPHSMGDSGPGDSKSHVAHMSDGDFYGGEKSLLLQAQHP